ncbi:PBAN-type neuropeptides-like [Chironomus tepperi]|uniref:PBAN-type neuropeptides-like n=1 Tax=Chironomus tepperi TaxID=113505 RepID=UPI00391F1B3B
MLAVFTGFLVFYVIFQGALCGNVNDEYSVGTNVNKYLYQSKPDGMDEPKRSGRPTEFWFGPRIGKRSQQFIDDLPTEFLELIDKIDKSPDLQKIILEKFLADDSSFDGPYIPKFQQRSKVFAPRYGRDSPDVSQNLNSRPYPPRFGRQSNLPPYLPRLGRSAD